MAWERIRHLLFAERNKTTTGALFSRIIVVICGVLVGACSSSPSTYRPAAVSTQPVAPPTDREYAEIAMNPRSRVGRQRGAVAAIDDQAVLAEVFVGIYDGNSTLADQALARIRDQDVLEAIALGDFGPSVNARRMAIQRIDDPTRLARLYHALADDNPRLGATILVSTTDIALLTRLAENHPTEEGKHQARSRIGEVELEQRVNRVRQMDDEAKLVEIAYSDQESDVRGAAVDRIQTASTLTQIVVDLGGFVPGCFEAIQRLRVYPEGLAQIALNAKTSQLRLRALELLREPDALTRVLVSTEDEGIDVAVVRRLADKDRIWEVASRAESEELRKFAVEMIEDSSRLEFSAANDPDFQVRAAALMRVDNPRLLAAAALDGAHHWDRYIGAARSNDRGTLQLVVNKGVEESPIAELKLALQELRASSDALQLSVVRFTHVSNQPSLIRGYGETVTIGLRGDGTPGALEQEFRTRFPATVRMSEINNIIRSRISRDALVELLSRYLDVRYDDTEQLALAAGANIEMLAQAAQ